MYVQLTAITLGAPDAVTLAFSKEALGTMVDLQQDPSPAVDQHL